eukprot:UN26483
MGSPRRFHTGFIQSANTPTKINVESPGKYVETDGFTPESIKEINCNTHAQPPQRPPPRKISINITDQNTPQQIDDISSHRSLTQKQNKTKTKIYNI